MATNVTIKDGRHGISRTGTWSGLAAGETGDPIDITGWQGRIQASVTDIAQTQGQTLSDSVGWLRPSLDGAGSTVTLWGSLDGTSFFQLHDVINGKVTVTVEVGAITVMMRATK